MVIVYCPKSKNKNHNYEYDKSSKGILLRCRNCNNYIVNLPKEVYHEGKNNYSNSNVLCGVPIHVSKSSRSV